MAEKQFLETLKFVEKAVAVLDNEEKKNRILHLADSIRNASELEVDEQDVDRRTVMLNLNALALAQQSAWEVFREDKMTKDIEVDFRELPSAEEAQAAARLAEESVKSEEDAISEKIKEFRERAKKFDIVRAVCNGQDPKEALAAQAEYEKNAQAMRG